MLVSSLVTNLTTSNTLKSTPWVGRGSNHGNTARNCGVLARIRNDTTAVWPCPERRFGLRLWIWIERLLAASATLSAFNFIPLPASFLGLSDSAIFVISVNICGLQSIVLEYHSDISSFGSSTSCNLSSMQKAHQTEDSSRPAIHTESLWTLQHPEGTYEKWPFHIMISD